jgi:hypothetical protein
MDIITFLAVYVKTLYEKTHSFACLQIFVALKHFVELDSKKIDYYVLKQLATVNEDNTVEEVMCGAFYASFLDENHRNVNFVKFLIWLQLALEKSSRSGSVEEHVVFELISREFYKQLRVSLKRYMHLIS